MGHLSRFVSKKNVPGRDPVSSLQHSWHSMGAFQRLAPACFFIERYGTVGTWDWGCEVYASTGLICHIISHQVKKKEMGLFVLLPSHSSSTISLPYSYIALRKCFGNHQVSHSRLWSEPGAASSNPSETGTDLPAQRGAGGLDGKGSKFWIENFC